MLTPQVPTGGRALGGIVLRVDVRLLGPLQILDPTGAELEVPGARLKALVALLALEAPTLLSGDVLLTHLWPESETPSKSALHAAISRIRSVLGDAAIETTQGGYRLQYRHRPIPPPHPPRAPTGHAWQPRRSR